MSNRQLGWDDQRIRNRLSPRELDEADKAKMEQQAAEDEQQLAGDDDHWIPPGNSDQGSRK
jgi:hypothetical protein